MPQYNWIALLEFQATMSAMSQTNRYWYLGLVFAMVIANCVIMPLIWRPWPWALNTYVIHQSNWNLTGKGKEVSIHNFHLHSDFKLYSIYPYRRTTRGLFELWLDEQADISLAKLLHNIGDPCWNDRLLDEGVAFGAVIASPSKFKPDYFYQWIRDGAITLNTVINYLSESQFQNSSVQATIENYLNNTYHLQRIDNPSGAFDSELRNLGEPKFEVDSTPYTGSWGRPQNDGPPLRVLAVDNFIKKLEAYGGDLQGAFGSVDDIYDNIIKLDLEYIVLYWKDLNFDLWEEIHSQHFFTSLVQLKALKIGIKYAKQYDDQFVQQLQNTFDQMLHFINVESGFVNSKLGHIVETPQILDRRSGLDAAIMIGSLLTHDDFDDVIPFDVHEGLILNSLSGMVQSMKYLYPINHDRLNLNLGVALGRYSEDVYDGAGISEGNPWFLCTLAASELMFKMIDKLYREKVDLVIDGSNRRFFHNHIVEIPDIFDPKEPVSTLRIPYLSLAFNQTIVNMLHYGDSFLDVVREHVANDGSMSEQFNKYTGYMQGAEDLTWSYGAFWNAYRWRTRAFKLIN